jgi:hypothetical protein
VLEVPRQIVNGHARSLTGRWSRHIDDTSGIAHVRWLDDNIVGVWAAQVAKDKVLNIPDIDISPLYDE